MPAGEIVPFLFENQHMVRTVVRDSEPWFVASDICRVLGVTNSRQAIRALDPDEKGVISSDTPGGPQDVGVISEAGMYTLVLRSRKSGDAKRFRRWVTHDVLPAIRKTGSYDGDLSILADHMRSMQMALLEMGRQLEDIRDGFDQRLKTVVDFKPMIDFLIEERVPKSSKRQALAAKMGHRFADYYHARGEYDFVRYSSEVKRRRIFQVGAVYRWLEAEGRALIQEHRNTVEKQLRLQLTVIKGDKPDR